MKTFKKGDRVRTTGAWLKKVGLHSDTRIGTVVYSQTWSSGTIMCEVIWDGEGDISPVNASNLQRIK